MVCQGCHWAVECPLCEAFEQRRSCEAGWLKMCAGGHRRHQLSPQGAAEAVACGVVLLMACIRTTHLSLPVEKLGDARTAWHRNRRRKYVPYQEE